MPPRKSRRELSPFEVIGNITLADEPRKPLDRVLAPPSDYEIILAQGYEIMDLRRQLEEARDASGS